MPDTTRIVAPGPSPGTVLTQDGQVLRPPADWDLLPPGDAGLTRRVKAAGPTWTVQTKRGRKLFSQGVWAPARHIERARLSIETERETPAYQRKREADARRRDQAQREYVTTFEQAILKFLAFDASYDPLARALAAVVTAHATPVGSGTVARTQRIPVEQRAQAAVIAWMRHQTTAYDHMVIPRVKGARRQVRAMLARRSVELLAKYRRGEAVALEDCPLQQALKRGPVEDHGEREEE